MKLINRAVLLGDPGAGKSTLSLKLCYDLSHHYSQRLLSGRRRDLRQSLSFLENTELKRKYVNVLYLISLKSKRKQNISFLPSPAHAFEYLLLTGRAVVFFDGLDELLDTSYRQEIRDDIEAFCHFYPAVPVLITSRKVGYEQAPLDKTMFEVFDFNYFDEGQVKEYVRKWFTVVDEFDLTKEQRIARGEGLLKDSEMIQDLRSNPLMLALLCTIYHEEHYIPRHRPDVYEKCAIMLFERWDKSRSIYIPPLPEEEVRASHGASCSLDLSR